MFVFSNLAITLDGKIGEPKRGLFPLGTREDRRQMNLLRQQCDAILIGASTLRSYRKPCIVTCQSKQPVNLLLSSALRGISPGWKFFNHPGIERILFLTEPRMNSATLKKFSTTSEIVTLKKTTGKNPLALQILNFLEKRKICRLLVEGGGQVMWHFVEHNLIDEYHVTVTPQIMGGEKSPTLVDGKGFSAKQILQLELQQCRIVDQELYLTYRKKKLSTKI